MGSSQPISRIAIIGAGPSGLAAAKYMIAEKAFDQIDVFEQRSRVGGIWNRSSPEKTKTIPIPQTNPRYGAGDRELDSLELESPLYDYLETNIPKELIVYSDKKLSDSLPLFVGNETLLQYLEEYADDIHHLIKLDTQVQDVRPHETSSDLGSRWQVSVRNLVSEEESSSTYDAVIVANGHFTIPFVPDVRGLDEWNRQYPGCVIHSKAYRKPEEYKDQTVLVVGNSVSGLDIASQIGPYCRKLLLSARSPSSVGPQASAPWREDVPGLAEFLSANHHDRAIKFVDGRVERHVDAVIFATGYFYNFPFLSSLDPPLTTHGLRTEHLYKHLFYIDNPTLAFPVLNVRVIPFPLSENQASVIARVWSGRLSLPSKHDLKSWEQKVIGEMGSAKDFHILNFPKDAEVLNEFYNWAASARRVSGLENKGQGKLGTFWDERLVWMRSELRDIKEAYSNRGEERFRVRTVKELGFDFEKLKELKQEQGHETPS